MRGRGRSQGEPDAFDCRAIGPLAHAGNRQILGQPHGIGQFGIAVSQELDFAERAGGFGPDLHDVGIVDRSADDLFDASRAQLGSIGDKARQMINMAGGRKRAGDGEEHHEPRAQHGVAGRVGGALAGDQLGLDGRNWTAALDHIVMCPILSVSWPPAGASLKRIP